MNEKRCIDCAKFSSCTFSMNDTACYEWKPKEDEEVTRLKSKKGNKFTFGRIYGDTEEF